MSDLKQLFTTEVTPQLQEKMGVKNAMAVPRLNKIVVNASSREYLQDKKNIEKAKDEMTEITGQKPRVTKARISIATFKLREGDQIGLSVTLRGKRMYDFFEKLVKIVLPRVKDFSGISEKAFDEKGNITIGFSEHTVFPEIEPGKVDKIRSLQLTVVTTAKNSRDGKLLLEAMGMPFKKHESTQMRGSVMKGGK